jgi:hypothetical protein
MPGTSNAAHAPPFDLSLARANGSRVELASLPGPKLVFLFATYDEASQFALVPLSSFLESEPRISAIGIALQPDAKTFLDMYKRSLGVTFDLYYDPDNQILQAHSALGPLRSIPAFVALDSEGRIRQLMYGAANPAQLRILADAALQP